MVSIPSNMTKLLLVLAIVVGLASALPAEQYTTKYDNVNIDEILNNDRLYNKYYDCLRNKGKCTPDGQELKDKIPEALETNCSKCSKKQRDNVDKVFLYISEKKPEHLEEVKKIYDPTGEYFQKYKEGAKERGVIIP